MKAKRIAAVVLSVIIALSALPLQIASAASDPPVTSTFSISANDSTFTITRSDTSTQERVIYRTVGITAYETVNFERAIGTLVFEPQES